MGKVRNYDFWGLWIWFLHSFSAFFSRGYFGFLFIMFVILVLMVRIMIESNVSLFVQDSGNFEECDLIDSKSGPDLAMGHVGDSPRAAQEKGHKSTSLYLPILDSFKPILYKAHFSN